MHRLNSALRTSKLFFPKFCKYSFFYRFYAESHLTIPALSKIPVSPEHKLTGGIYFKHDLLNNSYNGGFKISFHIRMSLVIDS